MATRDRLLQVWRCGLVTCELYIVAGWSTNIILGCPDDFVFKSVWPLPSYCLVALQYLQTQNQQSRIYFQGSSLHVFFLTHWNQFAALLSRAILQSHTDTWGKTLDFSRLELCKTNSGSEWDHLRRTGQYPWKYSGGPRSLVLAIWTESAAWLVVDKGFSVKVFVPSTLPSNGCTIPRRKKPAQVATKGAIFV